ncbi:MAG TPA: peptidylprolyl isomerase [Acidobacteriota bacterium]|nr:peptidylprolyl isomerase [Acidobacteriota bacterium]
MTLELYKDKAPSTVDNFLSYVDEKFYDGTIFHRVIKGFMIQGGGLNPDFVEKEAKAPINNEADNGLKNKKYTIAMARTSDPHSATCQFFINHADNAFLDYTAKTVDGWGYCVFGKVIEGTDTVEAIANTPTTTAHGMRDVPTETIKIISIRRK